MRRKSLRQGVPAHVREGARQLHAGGAGADDDEGEPLALALGVRLALGGLEGQQHAPRMSSASSMRLEARGEAAPTPGGRSTSAWRPWRAPGCRRASRRHRRRAPCAPARRSCASASSTVMFGRAGPGGWARRCPPGLSDGGGHLIEQRLEQVVVVAVDHRHIHGGALQLARGLEAPEASAHDDHVMPSPGVFHAGKGGPRGNPRPAAGKCTVSWRTPPARSPTGPGARDMLGSPLPVGSGG